MASILNTSAPLSSEISMTLQLLALGVLIIGFLIVKRKNYTSHAVIMLIATIMNTAAILTVMIPVALRLAATSIPEINFLFRSHILLGLIVEVVSIYILADWRYQEPGPTCFQRKNWMLGLSLFWMTELIIGMILFMKLYP
ncbi:MAG: hypothetical protein V1710_02785 [Candidatus Bathyarchaeota archaeon]